MLIGQKSVGTADVRLMMIVNIVMSAGHQGLNLIF